MYCYDATAPQRGFMSIGLLAASRQLAKSVIVAINIAASPRRNPQRAPVMYLFIYNKL